MKPCRHCGEENPDHARFCLACGGPLAAEPPPSLEVRKTVTALFCDVTGSTNLGERADPETVRAVMSRYYERVRAVLERHGGTIEKFIGDAFMAVFGIPAMHEDDALRALRAAVELRDEIGRLNEELEEVFGLQIDVRIGVCSGEVIAGDPTRGEAFAAGDAVNVAQRLEGAAAPGEILIGDPTHRLARDAIRSEPLAPFAVKGRDEPVRAHRLLDVLPGLLSHARRFDSSMVGRDRELALLEDAFERAVRERSCHLFTVLGTAGVGKSRLLAEALTQIGDRASVLRGACLPYGEGITFWSALEVVKQAAGISDSDSPARARDKIDGVLAGEESSVLVTERVSSLVGLGESGAVAEEGFWGFRKLLEALARRSPLVVCFDDANWAEPSFLDLVDHIADWTRDAPILLVCLARPDLLDARPAWGGGKRNATSILLEPLSKDESSSLLAHLLDDAVAGDILERVHASAEGNPLFVEEFVAMLIDGGLLRRNGRWTVAGDLAEIPVPDSIQVLLASRLDQLSAGERRAIERAAVEGTAFHRGAVEALADDELRGSVDACLGALERKDLIRPHKASFAGEDGFRFRHVLIREAAYDALPKQVRAELHERYAQWLEEVAGERVAEVEELIGYHLEQAYRYRVELARVDDHARALALGAGLRLGAAGRRALDARVAVNLLERAVRLLPPEDPTRLALLPAFGLALTQSGELARAEEVLSSAIDLAAAAGNRQAELDAVVERVALRLISHPDEGVESLLARIDESLPELEELGDDRALARAWYLIGLARHIWGCRFALGEEALERALGHARRAGDRRQEGEIRQHLWYAAWVGPTPVPEAIRRCNEVLETTEHDRLIEAGAMRALAALVARRGEFADARNLLARASEAYHELGMRLVAAAIGAFGYGDIEVLAGDYAAAERELRLGYAALEEMGEKGYLSGVASFLAHVLYVQGRYDEAEQYVQICGRESLREDVWVQVLHLSTRAKLLARHGEHSEAEQLARDAIALCAETDGLEIRAAAALDLAEVLRLAGRAGESAAPIEAAIALYEQKGNLVAAERSRGLLAGVPLRR
jgi:class 3 adenylate cyclase/tetratricopeptide (TPR) repeat protein